MQLLCSRAQILFFNSRFEESINMYLYILNNFNNLIIEDKINIIYNLGIIYQI